MKIFNERGFMLLSTIILTMIVSMAAMIVLNGTKKIHNQNSTLRIVAINLANEQFAEIESLAFQGSLSAGSYDFLGDSNDLKNYYNDDNKVSKAVIFNVFTNVSSSSDLYNVSIKVTWNFDNEDDEVNFKKVVRHFK